MLAVPVTEARSIAPSLSRRASSCGQKVAYASRQAASRAARVTHGGRDDLGRFHAYQCDYCHRWHFGH